MVVVVTLAFVEAVKAVGRAVEPRTVTASTEVSRAVCEPWDKLVEVDLGGLSSHELRRLLQNIEDFTVDCKLDPMAAVEFTLWVWLSDFGSPSVSPQTYDFPRASKTP